MTTEQKIQNKVKEWEFKHKEALDDVQLTLQGAPELAALASHLMETDANPYGYLPNGWQGALATAASFSSFLGTLRHALYDDGDISFPIVNGAPRIAFVWQHEDNYADLILSETEKSYREEFGTTYEITFASGVFDFIRLHLLHHSKAVYKWFVADAARHGVEFAERVYNHYANFDPEWVESEEVLAEIAAKAAARRRAGF